MREASYLRKSADHESINTVRVFVSGSSLGMVII